MTRRQWLILRLLMVGCPMHLLPEAVATNELAHPEWDMDAEIDLELELQ